LQIATKELSGRSLAYAVALALGASFKRNSIKALHAYVDGKFVGGFITDVPGGSAFPDRHFAPQDIWSQGGPLIERLIEEGFRHEKADWSLGIKFWRVNGEDQMQVQYGPTTLVAAMRCYVASKLGENVNVPEELLELAAQPAK
jgi:hypothetical protein